MQNKKKCKLKHLKLQIKDKKKIKNMKIVSSPILSSHLIQISINSTFYRNNKFYEMKVSQ